MRDFYKSVKFKDTPSLKPAKLGFEIFSEAAADVIESPAKQTIIPLTRLATSLSKPRQFVKEQYQALKTPLKTAKQLAASFKEEPVATAVEFYAFNKALGMGKRTIKRNPVARYIAEERYIASFPKSERRFVRAIVKSSKYQ